MNLAPNGLWNGSRRRANLSPAAYTSRALRRATQQRFVLDSSGPLGTIWVGFGLGAFYLALIWINVLLGNFLTPLFLIPITWLMDAIQGRRNRDRTVPARR